MTYPEAIEYLYSLARFGMKLGLENTRALAALCGNPHERLRFIHVAGTNGKGSTCAFLESICRASGYRVGLFTSPHLVSFRERLQVNRQLIPETDVVRLTALIREIIKRRDADSPADLRPTFFEFVTLMALLWFSEQSCDVVVWETGMGGRLDSTNIVTPLVSVITPIAMDHQQWLGESIVKIAEEKAGIIKPGVPVVSGIQSADAMKALEHAALRHSSALFRSDESILPDELASLVAQSLPGDHQQANAALSLSTIRAIQDSLPVPLSAVVDGLKTVHWSGRLQIVQHDTRTFVLDCAHNDAGFAALVAALGGLKLSGPFGFILGLAADKDAESILNRLVSLAAEICFVPLALERSADPKHLAVQMRTKQKDAKIHVAAGFRAASEALVGCRAIVVCGSFFLIGEAMEELQLTEDGTLSERGLNHWRS